MSPPDSLPPPGEACPVCGGALASRQCRRICQRCGALVSNCNGD